MTQPLTVLMAQINPIVGAIESNTDNIIQIITTHQQNHDLIIFPELAICGYPPGDLLLRQDLYTRVERALQTIAAAALHCHIVLGHPQIVNGFAYNSASILYRSKVKAQYHKQQLPNYGVFDEKRYFTPGKAKACVFTVRGHRIGLGICEDLWQGQTVDRLIQKKVDILLFINASPFDGSKSTQREALIRTATQKGPIFIYVNLVGGQDDLVFDGQSMVMDADEQIMARAPACQEALHTVKIHNQTISSIITPPMDNMALIYQALILGLRDYVEKNNMPGVLLGLSGGIDSALTLAIAVDALGAERVTAVLLPSRYSADISTLDAEAQTVTMQVTSKTIPIEPAFTTLLDMLPSPTANLTQENIQARIRGLLLMALSNQTGHMLLSTSNKSETAVGYATLYGDMCGGYAVLKDVYKTMVYDLARYRNQQSTVIPERVISRAPSAELAPNQTDQDSLPDYATLDAIIQGYMEEGLTQEQLVALGYATETVIDVIRRIKHNEYKRHQAPPGPKISTMAFGKDWRYPITEQFTETLAKSP
ncbi:MAG: NAD+ synthase [Gammaproteobacteria bacterium]|nr:NAD+ synthase [Gammaproteobacteria bacterium]